MSAYDPQRHCACATEPRQKLVRRLAQSLCGTVSAAQHANRAHGGGGSALRPKWAQLQRLPRAPAFARQRKQTAGPPLWKGRHARLSRLPEVAGGTVRCAFSLWLSPLALGDDTIERAASTHTEQYTHRYRQLFV